MRNSDNRLRGRPRSTESDQQRVKALDRGLEILKALAATEGMALTSLALDLDMSAPTLHRMLTTLAHHGFVSQSGENGHWHIGIEAFRIGSAFSRTARVLDVARPYMRDLMQRTGETANLGLIDLGEVVFVAQVETHQAIRAFFRTGSRGPIHASGIGKCILAYTDLREQRRQISEIKLSRFTQKTLTQKTAFTDELRRIKAQAYALDDEERHEGMRCVAAPIFNAYSEVIAAVSVSGPIARLQNESLDSAIAQTREIAQEISLELGWRISDTQLD